MKSPSNALAERKRRFRHTARRKGTHRPDAVRGLVADRAHGRSRHHRPVGRNRRPAHPRLLGTRPSADGRGAGEDAQQRLAYLPLGRWQVPDHAAGLAGAGGRAAGILHLLERPLSGRRCPARPVEHPLPLRVSQRTRCRASRCIRWVPIPFPAAKATTPKSACCRRAAPPDAPAPRHAEAPGYRIPATDAPATIPASRCSNSWWCWFCSA